jgi:hypothetical protein
VALKGSKVALPVFTLKLMTEEKDYFVLPEMAYVTHGKSLHPPLRANFDFESLFFPASFVRGEKCWAAVVLLC